MAPPTAASLAAAPPAAARAPPAAPSAGRPSARRRAAAIYIRIAALQLCVGGALAQTSAPTSSPTSAPTSAPTPLHLPVPLSAAAMPLIDEVVFHDYPSGCRGGEACDVQPSAYFVDEDGLFVDTSLNSAYDGGVLYAAIDDQGDGAGWAYLKQDGLPDGDMPFATIYRGSVRPCIAALRRLLCLCNISMNNELQKYTEKNDWFADLFIKFQHFPENNWRSTTKCTRAHRWVGQLHGD